VRAGPGDPNLLTKRGTHSQSIEPFAVPKCDCPAIPCDPVILNGSVHTSPVTLLGEIIPFSSSFSFDIAGLSGHEVLTNCHAPLENAWQELSAITVSARAG
jgi:hypothetical protein